MPDGGTTIIIQGKSRFVIESVFEEDPYFKAKIKKLEEEKGQLNQRIIDLNSRISQ